MNMNRSAATETEKATAACFGQGTRLIPKFERADVILALDSEFLSPSDKGPGFAHGFFPRRNPDQKGAPMNRLYVVENHYTGTGGLADHRYRCKASLIGEFARQLERQDRSQPPGTAPWLALIGASPKDDASFDEAWLTECANDLAAHPGRSLVTVGEQQPAWVQTLVFGINQALGNNGATTLGVRSDQKPVRFHQRFGRRYSIGRGPDPFCPGRATLRTMPPPIWILLIAQESAGVTASWLV